jgi:hypothetical protein
MGKTSLVPSVLRGDETHLGYLDWDYFEGRRDIKHFPLYDKWIIGPKLNFLFS